VNAECCFRVIFEAKLSAVRQGPSPCSDVAASPDAVQHSYSVKSGHNADVLYEADWTALLEFDFAIHGSRAVSANNRLK